MPAKRHDNCVTNTLVPSAATLVETPPPVTEALADALTNAVLDRVIQQVNLELS